MTRRLSGAGTALVTPFRADETLDEAALRRLVRRQVEAHIDFLVPCGTTGETPTLDEQEQERVIALTLEEAAGRVPVVAGAGSNDTRGTLARARRAERLGAHAVLCVGPYYNKPTPEGYYRHFTTLADALQIPVVVYNVPGRTGGNVDTGTLLRLAAHPNVTAVKEASGNFAQIMDLLRDRPADFALLSGDDALTLPIMALGGDGVISVVSNQIPGPMRALTDAARAGRLDEARALHNRFLRLMNLNFVESNPIPVKASLALMGLCEEVLRLPLVAPAAATREALRAELAQLGLLP